MQERFQNCCCGMWDPAAALGLCLCSSLAFPGLWHCGMAQSIPGRSPQIPSSAMAGTVPLPQVLPALSSLAWDSARGSGQLGQGRMVPREAERSPEWGMQWAALLRSCGHGRVRQWSLPGTGGHQEPLPTLSPGSGGGPALQLCSTTAPIPEHCLLLRDGEMKLLSRKSFCSWQGSPSFRSRVKSSAWLRAVFQPLCRVSSSPFAVHTIFQVPGLLGHRGMWLLRVEMWMG